MNRIRVAECVPHGPNNVDDINASTVIVWNTRLAYKNVYQADVINHSYKLWRQCRR